LTFLSVIHYWLADLLSLLSKVIGEVFNRLSAQQQQQTQTTTTTTTTTTATTTTTTTAANNNSKSKCIS